jgi:hypothetical protein
MTTCVQMPPPGQCRSATPFTCSAGPHVEVESSSLGANYSVNM